MVAKIAILTEKQPHRRYFFFFCNYFPMQRRTSAKFMHRKIGDELHAIKQ